MHSAAQILVPLGIVLQANPNQPVGPSGAHLSELIKKQFVEAVKTGEPDKLNYQLMTNQIEVRDVTDDSLFSQNLVFTAANVKDETKAMNFIKLLVSLGVDFRVKDNLKQTPLFYAAKNGHARLIQMMVENGLNLNEIDIYGQNAVYYAVNNGQLEATKVMYQMGMNIIY